MYTRDIRTHARQELDHWSDPMGTESQNVQLEMILPGVYIYIYNYIYIYSIYIATDMHLEHTLEKNLKIFTAGMF